MFQMLGAFAQFERSLIRERQREGIALAQKEGRPLGRAKALTREAQGANKKSWLASSASAARPCTGILLGLSERLLCLPNNLHNPIDNGFL